MTDDVKPAFDPTQPFQPAQADNKPAFDPTQPFQAAPAAPSGGADIAKSGGIGLAKGMIDFAGMPGDASNLLAKGSKAAGDYIGGMFGAVPSPEPTGPLLPTSGGIQKDIEKHTGEFYQPKTTAGKYAGAVGEVAGNPLSYVGPGGATAKLMGAAATGAGSEAAGQAAHEYAPDLEPYARVAGGILGGSTTGAISATAQNIMRARGIQTTEQLRQAANDAYAGARSLGVEYTPSNLVILRDQIRRDLLQQGHRADKSAGTFDRINELPHPLTPANPTGNRNFSDIEGVRQSLNDIRDEVTPLGRRTADARAAGVAIDRIDDFLANPMNAITSHRGIAQQAAQFAQEGRGNWQAMARSQQIEQALSKGELNAATSGSGANVDNALRQQVKQILNNPRRAKNFTNDDREIMRDIAAGNPVRNSTRLLGKMAATGIVSAAGIEYLSHTMGLGPIGHVLLPAAGYAAKKSGDIMTRNRINRLLQGIQMDSPAGRANPVGPRASTAPFAARSLMTSPFGAEPQNPYSQ